MVFYRKYRPQTIEELDSEEVRNTLSLVLSKARDSVPHAFLFSGAKGLGKTSAARIIAKAINCEQNSKVKTQKSKLQRKTQKLEDKSFDQGPKTKDQIEPCNHCSQCVSITSGTNLDVLEIDGASNRGIDEIRDLREKIRLLPASAAKKVYIIDEVHMLTIDAFNALLKTLEEPPPHAMFILCTTEPQKIPATILSRCFNVSFKRASEDELLRSFKRIAQKEKLKIDEDTLLHIASLSDGSFRDGVKILEELAALGKGEKITKELIEKKYQISNIKYQILSIIEFLADKNTKQALQLVSRIVKEGIDIKYFIEGMINELHIILLSKVGVQNNLGLKTYNLELDKIRSLIELLGKAYGELKYAVLPQLPLEMAIIEWGENNNAAPRAKKLEEIWQELLNKVKPYNHSVAGILRGCSLKSFDGKKLVIETNYKFHKERLEERKIQTLLEKVANEITGDKIIISVALQKTKGGDLGV